jgi:hypothetical protein
MNCTCANYRGKTLGPDHDAERVAAMVTAGIDQWAASRAVWGGEPPPPMTAADVPAWVRLVTAVRLPWLRLEAGAVSDSLVIYLGCLFTLAAVVASAGLGR